ncbi:hypothetical protein KUD11_03005 [Roseovarius sp. LXJ103]|uniref:hypothetical protein n=1 Tax=Roseovarius carneus TaxID=2853164 RepID=UPI000D616B96|nr:hypothetical protein [Roseovarius carneus]MBZ8117610.1 hypothetical protein [Roseovarius carneus]PWE37359.1 hypothetical protein DD563_11935 [Pelagicola sp. LXJ1103]
MRKFALILALVAAPFTAFAGAPEITQVRAVKEGMGWRFFVTIAHTDTGWDHYASGWEVVDANGTVLGVREFAHPYMSDEPFTRSLGHIMLPDGTREVFVRAFCSIGNKSAEPTRVEISYYD